MRDTTFHLRPRILGFRKDGRPIYTIAGASPDDPSNDPPAGPPSDPPAEPKPTDPPADPDKTFTQADVERIIQGRLAKYADYEDVIKERDRLREANQTEQEKAVTEARKEGEKVARQEAAKDLAREVFNGTAARRNADYDTTSALDLLDLGRFVKDDGSLDRDAIKDAVERLVPERDDPKPAPSFGGGARKTTADKADVQPGMGRLRAAYSAK